MHSRCVVSPRTWSLTRFCGRGVSGLSPRLLPTDMPHGEDEWFHGTLPSSVARWPPATGVSTTGWPIGRWCPLGLLRGHATEVVPQLARSRELRAFPAQWVLPVRHYSRIPRTCESLPNSNHSAGTESQLAAKLYGAPGVPISFAAPPTAAMSP